MMDQILATTIKMEAAPPQVLPGRPLLGRPLSAPLRLMAPGAVVRVRVRVVPLSSLMMLGAGNVMRGEQWATTMWS